MKQITDFPSLTAHLRTIPSRRKVAVVCPGDPGTDGAVLQALEDGFADFILVGGTPDALNRIPGIADYSGHVEIIPADTPDEAAAKAVALVREGCADVLMKGLISSDAFLHPILNKEHGILPAGSVLTHVTATEIPGLNRLLFFTDAAVIPFPTLAQREAMVDALCHVCRNFGICEPHIALIHCNEKINPKFQITLDYSRLIDEAGEGRFGSIVIGGPMDVKTACDAESGAIKGISSPVMGKADALMFPDIESANVFYKTISLFIKSPMAGILVGPVAPVILPSRSDSSESKYLSLAMGCLVGGA